MPLSTFSGGQQIEPAQLIVGAPIAPGRARADDVSSAGSRASGDLDELLQAPEAGGIARRGLERADPNW